MGQPRYRLQGPTGLRRDGELRIPRLKLSIFGEGGEIVSPEKFRLETSGREFSVKLPDIELDETLHEGTNTDRKGPVGARERQKTSLRDITARYDVKYKKLRGSFTANVPDKYPGMSVPVNVKLETTKLDPRDWKRCEDIGLNGQAEVGPASMEFKVRLRCDSAAFRRAMESVIEDGADPVEVLRRLPGLGIDASGAIQYLLVRDIPLLQSLVKSRFHAHLDPSIGRTRAHAPGFDLGPLRLEVADYQVTGVVPVPLFDVQAVGLGVTRADYKERSSRTLTLSATPTITPSPFAANLYLYFDVKQVWRVAEGVDFSLRLTIAPEAQKLGRAWDVLSGKAAPELGTRSDFLNEQQAGRRRRLEDPTASPVAGQGVDKNPFLSVKAGFVW